MTTQASASFKGSLAAGLLADRMAEYASSMQSDAKTLEDYVLSAAQSDPHRMQRMRLLFNGRARFADSIKEFCSSITDALRDASDERDVAAATRWAADIQKLGLADAAIDDRIRELSSRTHEPIRIDDPKNKDFWGSPNDMLAELFTLIGQRLANEFIELREQRRAAAVETIIVKHLAALESSLLEQQAAMRSEADLIRKEKELDAELSRAEGVESGNADKEATPSATAVGAEAIARKPESAARDAGRDPIEDGKTKERELDADRAELIGRFAAEAARPTGEDPSADRRAAAAAWAILRDERTRAMAKEAGVDGAALRGHAVRFARDVAAERDRAPSDHLLAAYLAAEREMKAIRDRAGAENRPLTTEESARTDHLMSQAREYVRGFGVAREKAGGDGWEVAARRRAEIHGGDVGESRKAIYDLMGTAPRPRDISKDAMDSTDQAYASVVPSRLVDAVRDAEISREAGNRARSDGTGPSPKVIVAQYDALEREQSRWSAVAEANKDTAIGRWAGWKAGAIDRELDARAARMIEDPDVKAWMDALGKSGAQSRKGFTDRVAERADRHETNVRAEHAIPPEERLFVGWQVLDMARKDVEAAASDPSAQHRLDASMRAQLTLDRKAIDEQTRQFAAAAMRSDHLIDLLADAHAGLGTEKTQALHDRLQADAAAFDADGTKRAEADVSSILSPDATEAHRGRTSRDASENISSLLTHGEAAQGVAGHFSISSRDAEARAREAFAETARKESAPRRSAAPGGAGDGQAAERPALERTREPPKPEKEKKEREDREKKDAGRERAPIAKQRSREEIEAERAAARKRARIERVAAETAARDLRSARTTYEGLEAATTIGGRSRANPAAAMRIGISRAFGKMHSTAIDVGNAWSQREPGLAKAIPSFLGNIREIGQEKSRIHVRSIEGLLQKMSDGKMTAADWRNLRAYGTSHELENQLLRGEKAMGRTPRLAPFCRRAANPERWGGWMAQQAPEILADIKLGHLRGMTDQREAEYRAEGGHARSGKNFPEGYVPTKDEIAKVRAYASDPAVMARLMDGRSKLEEIRAKYPGKSDEELAAMHFKKGRDARAGLDAERLYRMVDGVLDKDARGLRREPGQEMHEPMRAGKERQEAKEAPEKGTQGKGTDRSSGDGRFSKPQYPSGPVPRYGAFMRERTERQNAAREMDGGGRERGMERERSR
ncbi:hypothetical protein [Magnetospirillum sp. XM-1]|uniref:hypothetical protein n=1 Tax=Magnetospirillum sp. XM-1 TaxID=1663591 RepID=UPI0012E3C688|nr:hypothetical protein [Magnetospirillum sp. XM-1]